MDSLQINFWVVVLLVVLAVGFDFMNGFHDAANAIATVVATGVLPVRTAVRSAANSDCWNVPLSTSGCGTMTSLQGFRFINF